MDIWYFETAKTYFESKIYTVDDIRLFVEAERITKEQFKEITGEDFDKPINNLPIKITEDNK
ncbi:XkdX family protein [Paraclostridium sordellii]|uniref:XkdX family protein n=1 Tax=Paraclostridium sordellii TaxID=1505 RepID=UPI000E4C1120|nr:XkdX family protein [Paeniclostridium sordellii]RGX10523.1 XkdX family protein [Paeniclostridium sordellii]